VSHLFSKFAADNELRKTKKITYLDENVESLKTTLTDAEEKKNRTEISAVEVTKDCYPASLNSFCFLDTALL
jgi:hypothetical protein